MRNGQQEEFPPGGSAPGDSLRLMVLDAGPGLLLYAEPAPRLAGVLLALCPARPRTPFIAAVCVMRCAGPPLPINQRSGRLLIGMQWLSPREPRHGA